MSKNELPADGDWAAVHAAVRRQMNKLDLSIARLSRESGAITETLRALDKRLATLSNTIRAIDTKLGVLLKSQP